MENPPSQYQASIPTTFSAPTLSSRVLHTTTASTITSITTQTIPLYASTLLGSTIQTDILYDSTIIANNIVIDTLLTSSFAGSTIQTDIIFVSSLTGNTIQTNTLYVSSGIGSTIQISTCDTQTILGSTIQTNTFTTSTVSGNIIQTNTQRTSTLIGSTIQSNTLRVSTLLGSTIQHNQIHTGIVGGSTISANVFQPTTLQLSTLTSNNIQINTTNISTLLITGNTFQTNNFNFNTISGSTIQAYAINVSTLIGSTIIGCTIQTNAVSCSTILGSTIQVTQLKVSTLIGSTCQIKQGTISTIRYSTLIGSTFQTNQINISTITASTIKNNIIQMSTLIGGIIQISTLSVSSLIGSTIQTSSLQVSSLSGSTIQVNILQVSTLSGSTIQTLQLNISTLICSTFNTNQLNGSTIIYSTIQTNALSASTIQSSTIIGSTIQTDTLQVSSISCSTMIGSIFNTNKILITNGNKTLSTSDRDATHLSYLTNLTSQAGGLGQANTWTAGQTFSNSGVYFPNLSTETPSQALAINASNQLVKFTPTFSIEGTLTQNYVPYASGVSTLSNSIIYRVNPTDIAIGQTTSSFPTGTGTTLSIAGQTQTTNVITGTGTISKIVMPDKRTGVNGLQIPGSNGCNFYMGTMNNNNSGNYTDTLYLNSIPTIDTSDSFNVRNNIVVTTGGTGYVTMPSFTSSATTGLTFSCLFILTGSAMPAQWARIFDIGDTTVSGASRGFLIAFNSDRTITFHCRQNDGTNTIGITTAQLTLNTMYHVVWTINTLGGHYMYINGEQVCTMTKVITAYTHPYFYLGKSNWSNDGYPNMTMFDFRMLNRSMTTHEVIGLYYSVKKISGTTILSGQYIVLNRPYSGDLNLAEIQVFSYEGGPNIITPSTSVSYANVNSSYPTSNFVDGRFDTMIHNDSTLGGPITINLGTTQPIYKIVIYNRLDCCWNRANGIVLTIQNSSNTVIYTSSPIPDKLGRTTAMLSETSNLTDYYYTFTYFPPYAAVIGDIEKTESSACKVNAVMFNKGTPGMRIYQGLNQASANYTSYKDLATTELGSGSDTNGITFGPNVTWSSYLKIGAGTNRADANTAQVISTNGNLHLDCGSNGRALYLNHYANNGSNVINSYTPWTHNSALSLTGTIYVRWGINVPGVNVTSSSLGMYWNSYARGFVTAEQVGCTYGAFSTYGTARNGWAGWGCGSKVTLMTDGTTVLFHDNSYGWVIWAPSQNDPWSNRRLLLGGGSVQCSQWWDRFMVFVNGYDTTGGYYYVNQGGGFGGSSDERIKKNIKPIDTEQSITFIRGIIPSYFCLKNNPVPQLDASGKETGLMYGVDTCVQSGFIAQNVLESAKNAGLPKSTVNNTYDYEQELLLPEERRKTLLGLSEIPLISHSYNALKGTAKKQDIQQTQIDEISNKCSILDTGLTMLQETVRQNAELLQQLMAKTS